MAFFIEQALPVSRAQGSSPILFLKPHLMERPDPWDPAVDFVGFRRGDFRGFL